jgi:hypothetical protein
MHERRRSMKGSRGFVTIGVVALVLVVSVALGVGAPEHARLLSLVSGHGWLSDDSQDQVVLANGQTGQVDYRDIVTNADGDHLEVVQTGNSAILVDATKGTAGALNLNQQIGQSQSQTQTSIAGDGKGSLGTSVDPGVQNELVPTNGVDMFDIHKASGEVALLDPLSNHVVAEKKVGRDLTSGVLDQHGVLWVESKATGSMIGLAVHSGVLQVRRLNNSVVAPGDDVLLSAVNGSPAVLDRSRGIFFMAPGGIPAAAIDIEPSSLARTAVVAPMINGSTIPLASPGTVILIRGSSINSVHLPGTQGDVFGPPVPFGSRIYVPDLHTGTVFVLNDQGHTDGASIKVSGNPSLTNVAIQNGSLFINNPDSSNAYSVLQNGTLLPINEDDPKAPTNAKTPMIVPTPAPLVGTAAVPTAVPTTAQPGSSPAPAVAATAPSAPVNPMAAPGKAQATVSWSAANADGSAITKYTVSWSDAGGGSVLVPGNQLSVVIPNLTNGRSYTFTVTAANGVGSGPGSQTQAVTPTSKTPGTTAPPIATAEINGSITVAWNKPDAGGLSISGYTVTPIASGGSTLTPVQSTGTGLSINLAANAGIAIGTSYTFTVTATSSSGVEGAPSAVSNAVTASAPPLAVVGLSPISNGKGAISVSWTSCVSACASGDPVTSYQVSLSPAPPAPITVPAASGNTQSKVITGLSDLTQYTVTVSAENKWGAGQPASQSVSTEGAPTAAVASYTPSGSGLTVDVNFTVDFHGTAPGTCSISNLTNGAAAQGGSCSSQAVSVPTYNSPYSGTLNVITNDYGTVATGISFQSGFKALDADGTPDYGPYNPAVTYSGPSSGTCPGPAFSGCGSNVAGPSTVYAACWTTGGTVNNLQSNASPEATSTVWLQMANGLSGYMSSMWFNPGVSLSTNSSDPSTSPAALQLPHC